MEREGVPTGTALLPLWLPMAVALDANAEDSRLSGEVRAEEDATGTGTGSADADDSREGCSAPVVAPLPVAVCPEALPALPLALAEALAPARAGDAAEEDASSEKPKRDRLGAGEGGGGAEAETTAATLALVACAPALVVPLLLASVPATGTGTGTGRAACMRFSSPSTCAIVGREEEKGAQHAVMSAIRG